MKATPVRRRLSSATKDFALRLLDRKDFQERIHEALDSTGRWHVRECPLSAPLMVWFVILMTLERRLSIGHLLGEVLGLLRRRLSGVRRRALREQAPMHARARLGVEPMKALFESIGSAVEPESSLLGLRPYIVDGVQATVPDTEANEEAFGRAEASRGKTGFPQIKGVALLDASSRRVKDVVWGDHKLSERHACEELLRRLGTGDLLMQDRGFAAVWLFLQCQRRGINFLCRLPSSWKPLKVKRLGHGEYLATVSGRVPVRPEDYRGGPWAGERSITVRIIEYKIGRNERVRLITNLLDAEEFSARKLAEAYHLRWDVEIAFKEIKTHLTTVPHGTLHTTFRSKTPEGVRQEAYGILIAYNLIRELMVDAGVVHNVPPLQISFLSTLVVVQREIASFEAARSQDVPRLLAALLRDIADGKIDRPRRLRQCPRVIKVKASKWKQKRDCHRKIARSPRRRLRLVEPIHASFGRP